MTDAIPQTCEACNAAPVEVVERSDSDEEPYRLCAACDERLHAMALRPREWYNLARRHGPFMPLLHDDFYDEDGTATAPEDDVVDAELHPAPTLADVAHSPATLLDFSITRWSLADDVVAAWKALAPGDVLAELSRRYGATHNPTVNTRILEVCAEVANPAAAGLVRHAWDGRGTIVYLYALAFASAACLPFREGWDRVCAVLDAAPSDGQRHLAFCLGYFHSPKALAWIEQHVALPITQEWGRLAADSGLDWPTVERWLTGGRPLSLVAIDALVEVVQARPPLHRGPPPRLLRAPDPAVIGQALAAYAERDPVPRVEDRIRDLLKNLDLLAAGGRYGAGDATKDPFPGGGEGAVGG